MAMSLRAWLMATLQCMSWGAWLRPPWRKPPLLCLRWALPLPPGPRERRRRAPLLPALVPPFCFLYPRLHATGVCCVGAHWSCLPPPAWQVFWFRGAVAGRRRPAAFSWIYVHARMHALAMLVLVPVCSPHIHPVAVVPYLLVGVMHLCLHLPAVSFMSVSCGSCIAGPF